MHLFFTRSTHVCCLVALLSWSGCRRSSTEVPTTSPDTNRGELVGDARDTPVGPVTFKIHDGDELLTFDIEEVREGTTLEAVMRRIDQIPVTIGGSGANAFVDKIGETATSGSEGWTYTVDGEFAMKGVGQITLSPPTTVEWKFGSMRRESDEGNEKEE
jgi:hypothetical protein